MNQSKEFGTIVLVTIVTLLIWLLAAAKTRETATIPARLTFTVAGDASLDRFQVTPMQVPVNITVEGGALAVRDAGEALRRAPLELQLPAAGGRVEVKELVTRLKENSAVRSAGAPRRQRVGSGV